MKAVHSELIAPRVEPSFGSRRGEHAERPRRYGAGLLRHGGLSCRRYYSYYD